MIIIILVVALILITFFALIKTYIEFDKEDD